MKILLRNILNLAIAATIAGTPLSARQEPDEKPKPEEPKKKQEPKPEDKPKPKPKEEKPKQEPAPPSSQQPDEKQRKEQAKPDKQKRQEQTPSAAGKPAQGRKIPEAKFHSAFGTAHHFRVARSGGDNRRFQSGGYVFEVIEWPVGWTFDDECYIEEEGDDYYLVDVVHPELRVIVVVVSG